MLRKESNKETGKFKEALVEELRFLKCVSQDLKNYREMIRLKKYD